MHIIKQLSEDEFVIKMDDYDLRKHDAVRIAHDYVQFYSPTTIDIKQPQNWEPYGRFKSIATNQIHSYSDIQISIRDFVKVVLPFLNNSKYCQESHITHKDGIPLYNYHDTTPLITISEDKTLVHIRQENGEYCSMPIDVYNSIKKQIKAE